jgi:hypothetical protein
VVWCRFTVLGSGLLYRVCASESYLDICLFKEVGDFSDFVAVICEGRPFFVFVVGFVCAGFMLRISFQSCYVMDGEFVVYAMVRIFCYSVSFLSVVRCSDVLLISSFSILSDDRFKASSKTIPPHSAI